MKIRSLILAVLPMATVIAAVIGFSTTAFAQSATGCAATASTSAQYPSRNTTVTITGNITCSSGDPSGATMTATFNYASTTATCQGIVENGTASCPKDIGGATYGYTVTVDVVFADSTAQLATATTSFTPEPAGTTPTPTATTTTTSTPSPTASTTSTPSPTNTPSPTSTASPSATATPPTNTPSPSPTMTQQPTMTATPSATPTMATGGNAPNPPNTGSGTAPTGTSFPWVALLGTIVAAGTLGALTVTLRSR